MTGRSYVAARSFVVGVLAATSLQFVTVEQAAAAPACPASTVSVSGAEAAAKRCAGPVEAMDRRTVDSRTLIGADGTATVEHHVAPRWVRRTDGGWTDIDTTLRFVDGVVQPAATLVPVTFSAKGTGPLAALSADGRRVAMSWPGGALPVPTLSGASATYADVLPGVDLRMTALAEGFSEVLVVKSPQAAANQALAKLAFGLETTGVTLSHAEDGGVHAKDGKGKVVFSSPRALMWDSAGAATSDTVTAKSAKAPTGGPGAPRVRAMGESLSGGKLTITPDPAFLTDPATQYPVYIDPTFTGNKSGNAWAVVASRPDLAGSTFWQTTFMNNSGTYGDAGTGLTCDNYTNNTCNSPTYKVRTFFRMETYGAEGASVISSNFEITQKWSWTCNTTSDAKLWVTGAFGSGTTWNNQPSWDTAVGHSTTAAANRAVGSANGCAAPGMVSFNTTSMVQWGFSQGWTDLSVGLQAANEGTNLQWKRFDSSTAQLKIRYDHAPTTPVLSDLKVGPTGLTSCGPSAGTATRVNTTNGLTLNAILSDVDAPAGDLVKAEWAVTGVAPQYAPAPETAGLTSGSNHQTTIPAAAFTNGAAISWQARGVDTDNTMAGGWSQTCHLLVDNTAPTPPGVTSTDLALRVGLGIVPAAKPVTSVVGRSATVTFAAAAADVGSIVGFRYGVAADADAVPTIWIGAAADGTAQAAVVPLTAVFYNSVVVTAVKADGTAGASTSARFRATAAGSTPHVLGDATGDGRADVTLLSDVGANKSAFWRWDSTPTGALSAAVAPQGNAGIFTNGATLTAGGDFDGDGLSDVATFAPAGSDVTVTAQRSDANQLLSTPVLQTMTGWTLAKMKAVGGGDVNADGRSDLIVSIDNGNVSWTLWVLLSTSTPGTISFAAPANWYQFPVGGSDPNKVKLVFGDFNGDGRADVGQFYDYGNVHTKLWMHWSQTNNTFTQSTLTWDSGVGGWGSQASKYVAGDFTGDGKTDIVSFYFPGGIMNGTLGMSTFVAKADGTGINAPTTTWTSPANTWDWTLTDPQTGDYDGDGKADIALAYTCCGPYQRSLYTMTSTGPSFGAPALRWQGGLGPLSGGSLAVDTTGTVKYQLVNVNSGKCLQIAGAVTTSGAWAQQWTCGATVTNQQFTVGRVGAVNVFLRPVHAPGQCLAVPGGSAADNAGIGQWACGPAPDQFQQLDYVAGTGANTMIRVRPTHSNKCVAIPNGSLAEGTGAIQWTCGPVADQTWYLRVVA